MGSRFQTHRRIEFRDTDAAGIAHFSALMVYFEQAEHEFLRHVGTSVMIESDAQDIPPEERVRWPRVHVEADFPNSVRFQDIVSINVSIARIGEKSVTYHFEMRHGDRIVCTGKTTAVCCLETPNGLKSVPIPSQIRKAFEEFASNSDC